MTADRAALVAGILANPDDDTPRLVAADWFEENGDAARGEFIRVQVNRARLPPTDPQQPELAARELRLLKEHAARWIGAHFAFKKCRFRRGFIEYVHLHLTHFLHHRRELLALEPVRDISLTGVDAGERVARLARRGVRRTEAHRNAAVPPSGAAQAPARRICDSAGIAAPHRP